MDSRLKLIKAFILHVYVHIKLRVERVIGLIRCFVMTTVKDDFLFFDTVITTLLHTQDFVTQVSYVFQCVATRAGDLERTFYRS